MNNDYTAPTGTTADVTEIKQSLVQNFQGDAANLNGDQVETQSRITADNTLLSYISSVTTNLGIITPQVQQTTSAVSQLTTVVGSHTSSINTLTPQVQANTLACTNLTTVVGSQTSSINTLTTAVSNETKARVSAIDTLSGSLASEITTRSNVDIIHSTQINTLQDGLAKELKDRKSADDALQLQIDARATSAYLQAVINNFNGSDEIIFTRLDTLATIDSLTQETKARTAADTSLQTQIDARLTTASANTTYLSKVDAATTYATQAAITAADTKLQLQIDAKASAADLFAEFKNRSDTDLTHSGQISKLISDLATEIEYRVYGDNAEIKNRTAADSKLQLQIDAKVSPGDLEGLLTKASAALTYATATSLTNETKARTDADTALQGQINTRAYSTDLAPLLSKTDAASTYATTTSLTNEVKIRADADTALSANITTLNAVTAKRYAIVNFGTPGVSNGKIAHIVSGTTPEFVVSTPGSDFGFKEIEVGDNLTLTQDTKSILLNLDGVATTTALTALSNRVDTISSSVSAIVTSGSRSVTFHTIVNGGTPSTVSIFFEKMGTIATMYMPFINVNIGTAGHTFIQGASAFPSWAEPFGSRSSSITETGVQVFSAIVKNNNVQVAGRIRLWPRLHDLINDRYKDPTIDLCKFGTEIWTAGSNNCGTDSVIVLTYRCAV